MMALQQIWSLKTGAFVLLMSMAFGLTACNRPAVSGREVGFELEASRDTVLVGENVTILAYSQNILGRDAQIEWDSSGGELFTEDRGQVARVYFDEPGTYTVQANLIVDGRLTRSASTTIEVQQIPDNG